MALANKYRPKSFSEVIGQETTVNALRNIIKNKNFHNGYIFSGTRGVGKTTLGRLFAKALNCKNYDSEKGETCNVCSVCEEINSNSHLDLIEIDAASRTGVDDMRDLLESVQYRPSSGNFKIYLIDEVHMLSIQSFNALLKTLEEPPAHVVFILATTEAHKIPKTIVSRCLQFNLKLVSDELISQNLKRIFESEGIISDDKSVDLLVELAKGSVRDSLTMADQAASHCDNKLSENEVSKLHGVLDISSTTKLIEMILLNESAEVVNELKRYSELDVNYEILFDRALKLFHDKIMESVVDKDSKADELNLFYQFFCNGLVDAKQTSSFRDCFDIAALRCLTFNSNDASEVKKKHENATSLIEPEPEPEISQSQHEHDDIELKEAKEPQKNLQKLASSNWLNIFDGLDLRGASRAFFANMQLDNVDGSKLTFKGSETFVTGINESNINDLVEALRKAGYPKYDIAIIEAKEAQVTPSSKWQEARNKELDDFKEEILKSDLVQNLNNKYGANINRENLSIKDHEE